MQVVPEIMAAVVASSLAVASRAKAKDRAATQEGFAALGVPSSKQFVDFVIRQELIVAALVVVVPRFGGLLALIMLALFTAVLFRVLSKGVKVPCSCFGARSNEPVSMKLIVRNALLMAASIIAAASPFTAAALLARLGLSVVGVGLLLVFSRPSSTQ